MSYKRENRLLRRMLWMRHGCPSAELDGNGGEMKCRACGIDFKKDDVEKIANDLFELLKKRAMEAYLEGREI